jgi:hypothetical protein
MRQCQPGSRVAGRTTLGLKPVISRLIRGQRNEGRRRHGGRKAEATLNHCSSGS